MSKIGLIALLIFNLGFQCINAQIESDKLTDKKIIIDGRTFYLYQVEPSEGLYRISKKFGVTQQEIVKYNPGIENGLSLGQVVKIPVIEGRNSSENEIEGSHNFIYHKVEKGQTLFFISRKYGVSKEDIIALNPNSATTLAIGTDLKIPNKVDQEVVTPKEDASYLYHDVKPKETLYSLSKLYNTSVSTIISENPGLESGILKIGTSLRIPKQNLVKTSTNQQVMPKVETEEPLEDESFYYHKLEAGETIYSIGLKYNVKPVEILKTNNIEDVSDIKIGYMVRIPKLQIEKTPGLVEQDGLKAHKPAPDFVIHNAEKNESLRFLSEKYNVEGKEIIALNPEISDRRWKKLRRNTQVKIPRTLIVSQQPNVDEKTKEEPITAQLVDSLSAEALFQKECTGTEYTKEIKVAYLGPFYLDYNDSLNFISHTDSLGRTKITLRYPKEIYPPINIFREFYFGSLLAIDSLKKMGISISVNTFDVKRNTDDDRSLGKLLASNKLENMDIIFGPAHANQVPAVAAYCQKHGIKLVLPFGDQHPVVKNNPFVYCLNTDETTLYPSVTKHILSLYEDVNVILVRGNTSSNRQELFGTELKQAVFHKKWDDHTNIEYFEVNFDKDGISGVEKLLSKDKTSVIIIASSDKKLFNTLLPSLYFLKEKKEFPISLIGFPEYVQAISNDLEYIFSLNTLVFNQYYVDYTDEHVLSVLKNYRNWFGGEPTVSHPSQGILHPNNGLLGYDATFYFINAIRSFGKDFDKCLPQLDIELTESDFNFKRENTWSGFRNQHVNFIRFSDDFEVYLMGSENN